MLSLSGFPLSIRFLSSASLPVPATWPLFLPFLFLPVSASQLLPRCCLSAFRLPCFSPFFPTWFPVSSFPVLRTRLSVCFLSSFPASLPQLFHRCFPLSTSLRPFLCRDLQLTFNFLSSILVRFKLLSFLTFLFPSSRYPLSAVISMHVSSSVQPVAMPSIRLWYSAHCNSFYRSLFRITVATTVSQHSLTEFS